MRRPLARIVLALALGVATTIASALALALWVPLEMYPRQTSHAFLAGGRPWNVVGRARLGVWNLWWSEINAAYILPPSPPATAVKNSLLGMVGTKPAPDPGVPTTPEGWLQLQRDQRKDDHRAVPLRYSDAPPSWGTFARGGSPSPGVEGGADHGFGWPRPALWYRVNGKFLRNLAMATGIEGGVLVRGGAGLSMRSYDFRAIPLRADWPGLLADSALLAGLWGVILFAPRLVRPWLRRRRGRCPGCGYDLKHSLASGCPECGWGRTIAGRSP
jgi:hypothetical protein